VGVDRVFASRLSKIKDNEMKKLLLFCWGRSIEHKEQILFVLELVVNLFR